MFVTPTHLPIDGINRQETPAREQQNERFVSQANRSRAAVAGQVIATFPPQLARVEVKGDRRRSVGNDPIELPGRYALVFLGTSPDHHDYQVTKNHWRGPDTEEVLDDAKSVIGINRPQWLTVGNAATDQLPADAIGQHFFAGDRGTAARPCLVTIKVAIDKWFRLGQKWFNIIKEFYSFCVCCIRRLPSNNSGQSCTSEC